jgi:hypothetical protein
VVEVTDKSIQVRIREFANGTLQEALDQNATGREMGLICDLLDYASDIDSDHRAEDLLTLIIAHSTNATGAYPRICAERIMEKFYVQPKDD